MGIFDWLFGKKDNVVGESATAGVPGVYGGHDADGNGVVGETNGRGTGVYGQSAEGDGVTGRAWTFGRVGVWGHYSDGEAPPQRGAAFTRPATAGVWGTTANEGDVPRDSSANHRLKRAAGVVGEASLPGDGYGYGVLGLGYRDEGVVGWSMHGAGGRFEGARTGVRATAAKGPGGRFQGRAGVECAGTKDPGIVATSTGACGGRFESAGQGQIRLVARGVEFGTKDDGAPYPKLPVAAASGELLAVTHPDGDCTLWLCVRSARIVQTGGGTHIPIPASWAPVALGTPLSGEG